MEWIPKYLHVVGHHASWLDHRVLPEVRAMFAAMMSRVPQGGIAARYDEVVEKIAKDLRFNSRDFEDELTGEVDQAALWNSLTARAEELLCNYIDGALHPIIQGFFDTFVGKYGHSSILELTGQPVVFIEHISWWLAYLTFDNPLVRGQEMSTRAVWKQDWPMAGDASEPRNHTINYHPEREYNSDLVWMDDIAEMHKLGLEIAKHEIEAWKADFRAPCVLCKGEGFGLAAPCGEIDAEGEPVSPSPQACRECGGTGKKHPEMWEWQDCTCRKWKHRPGVPPAEGEKPPVMETWVLHTVSGRTHALVFANGTGRFWPIPTEGSKCENLTGDPADLRKQIEERITCSACNNTGKYLVLRDPQGFRPAFDRARWALPGTIETGVAHTADLRTMARVIQVMEDFATASGQQSAQQIVAEVKEAYRQALPGMAGMGLKEAFYDVAQQYQQYGEQLRGAQIKTAERHRLRDEIPSGEIPAMSMGASVIPIGEHPEDVEEALEAGDPMAELHVEKMARGLGVDPEMLTGDTKYATTEIARRIANLKRMAPGLVGDAPMTPDRVLMHPDEFNEWIQYTSQLRLPGNLNMLDPEGNPLYVEDSRDVHVAVKHCRSGWDLDRANASRRTSRRTYVDPYFNHYAQVLTGIRCSLACSRDWHRHRTMMPWRLRIVREQKGFRPDHPDGVKQGYGLLTIDHHYTPTSEFGKENYDRYLRLCTELHDKYMAEGNQWMAMLCLPFGTRVLMSGQGGLRHAVYMTELRGYVAGGNFEYREQARTMLEKIEERGVGSRPKASRDLLGFDIPMEGE